MINPAKTKQVIEQFIVHTHIVIIYLDLTINFMGFIAHYYFFDSLSSPILTHLF